MNRVVRSLRERTGLFPGEDYIGDGKTMTGWSWNDAWILTATVLAHKRGGATLAEIIRMADALNHAIPTAGELSRAFSRLIDCGIVQVMNDRYLLDGGHRRAVKKVLEGKGGLFSTVDKCLKWLNRTGFEPLQSATVAVSDDDVKAAYLKYCEFMKKR